MISRGGSSSGGGPRSANGYLADAVHFDGSTWALIAALTAVADNGKATASIWVKATQQVASQAVWQGGGGDANNYLFVFSPGEGDALAANLGNTTSNVGSAWDATSSYGVWVNILFSCDLSGATPHFVTYQSDVVVGSLDQTGSFPASPDLSGSPFAVGNDPAEDAPAICDVADFQLWNGVSIVTASDTILTANRQLFISAGGKPVDPAVAQVALGTPTLALTGNAASWTSLLTGYGFTITGTITNASSSPSD